MLTPALHGWKFILQILCPGVETMVTFAARSLFNFLYKDVLAKLGKFFCPANYLNCVVLVSFACHILNVYAAYIQCQTMWYVITGKHSVLIEDKI